MSATPDRIRIEVDEDVLSLIPTFLKNRHHDIETILSAVEAGDLETVRRLGHSMKGSGGGYGFQAITEIGGAIERAACRRAVGEIREQVAALSDYLAHVEVVPHVSSIASSGLGGSADRPMIT